MLRLRARIGETAHVHTLRKRQGGETAEPRIRRAAQGALCDTQAIGMQRQGSMRLWRPAGPRTPRAGSEATGNEEAGTQPRIATGAGETAPRRSATDPSLPSCTHCQNDKVEQLAANRFTIPQDATASLLQRLVLLFALLSDIPSPKGDGVLPSTRFTARSIELRRSWLAQRASQVGDSRIESAICQRLTGMQSDGSKRCP